jgi:hypothetical protein
MATRCKERKERLVDRHGLDGLAGDSYLRGVQLSGLGTQ